MASQRPVGSSATPSANDPPEETDVVSEELAIAEECTWFCSPSVEITWVPSALKVNDGTVVLLPTAVTKLLGSMVPSECRTWHWTASLLRPRTRVMHTCEPLGLTPICPAASPFRAHGEPGNGVNLPES